ncbi:hypothetical protein Taro_003531 [Colocasia esculenta]|uniref:Uncharacterized protein n=1 Tax=Colocasia esculenta TaxID=4460 RepID=A0A843TNY0_COLES|nr:hypothetical protein [Colocasia esculenta]
MFCKGSVDTPLTGVDTMLQTQGKKCRTGQVVSTLDQCRHSASNTRQKGQVVSTLDQVVSTLETLPRTPSELVWDSVSTLDQLVSTLEALPEQNL